MKARAVLSSVMFRSLPYYLCLGKVDAIRRGGTKEIKSQTGTTLENINILYIIAYFHISRQMTMSKQLLQNKSNNSIKLFSNRILIKNPNPEKNAYVFGGGGGGRKEGEKECMPR